MNTLPPNEPLDEQEREFARILHALPGGEPSPALDAAILRAANNAAASSKRPVKRMLASAGALWGVGSAAAAVLALGVAWQLRYGVADQAASEGARAPQAQLVSDAEEDQAVSVELGTQPADPPFVPPPPPPPPAESALAAKPAPRFRDAPAQPARDAAATAAAPAAAPASPEPFAADHLDEHVAQERAKEATSAEAGARAEAQLEQKGFASDLAKQRAAKAANAAPPPAPATAAPAPASSAEASAGLAGGAAAQATRGDDDSLGRIAVVGSAKTEDSNRKPATWLADIRKLRDQGRLDEARASLVEFRKKYPKWVVPTDLAPLLSE